jgi:hypothetical protein
MPTLRISEATSLPGVSTDTLRRWTDGGRSPVSQRRLVLALWLQSAEREFGPDL